MHIPVEEMTLEEKLQTIEEIWDNLQRTAEQVPVPGWHADVPRARAQRVREGVSKFRDWGEAKQRIREQTT